MLTLKNVFNFSPLIVEMSAFLWVLQTVVGKTRLLWLSPKVILPSSNIPKVWGIRCARQFPWGSSCDSILKWLCIVISHSTDDPQSTCLVQNSVSVPGCTFNSTCCLCPNGTQSSKWPKLHSFSLPLPSPVLPKSSSSSPSFPLLNDSAITHPERIWGSSKSFSPDPNFLFQSHSYRFLPPKYLLSFLHHFCHGFILTLCLFLPGLTW